MLLVIDVAVRPAASQADMQVGDALSVTSQIFIDVCKVGRQRWDAPFGFFVGNVTESP